MLQCLSMDIDLRLHSGDQGDDSVRGLDNVLHNSDIDISKIEEDVLAVTTGELVDYAEAVSSEQEVMPQVATPESLQQMDKLSPRTVGIESYYGTQQSVQTMVQLDLMGGPNRDNFYGNQQTMQGLRQLNSIAPSYDSYYTAQQGIHGQGVDFFRPPNFSYDIRDDPNVRTTQLHEDAPRHS
uniref:Uncharacterized protein n=1 Tax=Brassica campestris TaxID=3711 RepID=M4E4Z4_BRACM